MTRKVTTARMRMRARIRRAAKQARTARLWWVCCGTKVSVVDVCPRCGGKCG